MSPFRRHLQMYRWAVIGIAAWFGCVGYFLMRL